MKSLAILQTSLVRLIFCLGAAIIFSTNAIATSYYISNGGSNSNSGTSSAAPWADFTNVNSRTFSPGDNIFLNRGSVWNQEMDLAGSGTSGSYITLDAYGSGANPKIQRSSGANDRTIKMADTSFWNVNNLEICNAGDGIRLNYTSKGHHSVHFSSLYIHDINVIVNGSPSSTDNVYYSTGIVVFSGNQAPLPTTTSDFLADDIKITNCEIAFTTAPFTFLHIVNNVESPWSFKSCVVSGNNIHDFKGPCSVRDMNNSYIGGSNTFTRGGTSSLPQGTTGLFCFQLDTVFIQDNILDTISNTGSPDQTWIDNEAYCNNVQILRNTIKNTPGAGVEFLALGSGANPPRGSDDHNTNNVITGNSFSNNSSGALRVTGSTPAVPSGSASNNTYTGTFFNGNSSGFSLSNNTVAGSGGTGTINDTDTGISYSGSWFYSSGRGVNDYSNDIHASTNNGDYFQYGFTGTTVNYITETNSDEGNVDLYIDGSFSRTVNCYSASRVSQVAFTITGLSSGSHTIKGVKSGGTYIVLDAITFSGGSGTLITKNDTDASFAYSGTWFYSSGRGVNDINDDVHGSANNGDYFQYTFTGTTVNYITEKNSDEGNVDIYIDGAFQQTVSCNNATRLTQQTVYTKTGLSSGSHTIKGVKSSGTYIVLDAISFQ